MQVIDDIARFRPDDAGEIVAAAFACPVCLRAAGRVQLDGDEHDRRAECVCPFCMRTWGVALDDDQALRMAIAPPAL